MPNKSNRNRRVFSDEFKQSTVDLIVKEGYSIKAAADAVNVGTNTVRDWHRKLAPPPTPVGEQATTKELTDEIKRLRKQLQRAEMEREILKKATAYFAKESL
jgi:transposase